MRSIIFMRGKGVGDMAITALFKGFGSMLPFDITSREKWKFRDPFSDTFIATVLSSAIPFFFFFRPMCQECPFVF